MNKVAPRYLGYVLIFIGIVLAIAAFCLPASASSGWVSEFYESVLFIKDAESMALSSAFPAATAVAYSGAIIMGIAAAIFIAIVGPKQPEGRDAQYFNRTSVRPAFAFALLVLGMAAPIAFHLPTVESQRSHGFFLWVSQSRLGLALWVEAMFWFYFAAAYWCLLQIGKFFRNAVSGA